MRMLPEGKQIADTLYALRMGQVYETLIQRVRISLYIQECIQF